jgi:hypothetical protein
VASETGGVNIVQISNQPWLTASLTNGAPTLQLSGVFNQQYVVEYSPVVPTSTNGWTALQTLLLTNTIQTVTDAKPSGPGQRFYRARLVQ